MKNMFDKYGYTKPEFYMTASEKEALITNDKKSKQDGLEISASYAEKKELFMAEIETSKKITEHPFNNGKTNESSMHR